MPPEKRVRLQVHEYLDDNEIAIENIRAKSWGDILMMTYTGPPEGFLGLRDLMDNYKSAHPDKEILILDGTTSRIDFHGFETDTETESEDDDSYGSPVLWNPLDEIGSAVHKHVSQDK